MNICTIIAHNYLAHARVLAESFRTFHPESECVVLVIDEVDGHIDAAGEPFTLVRPEDLDFAEGEFADLATRYSVLELSTAVKPWLLQHMLRHHHDGTGIAYFDPDIRVYSRMLELEQALREHPVVLTPHLTEPMPRDGMIPNEPALLVAGSFNLGFIGLAASEGADMLLDWWAERLRTDCVVAPDKGLFVDQRWVDFVPGLVPDVGILRDPSYNIAYWNVATRELGRGSDGYTVNGRPLRFFHFSGFSPDRPDELSKHQNRVQLVNHPDLQRICLEYADALRAAGFETVRSLPYELDVLPSGLRIDPTIRALYRVARDSGEVQEPPADAAGEEAFITWLRQPAPEANGVSRYLYEIWKQRGDLQTAYPHVGSSDAAAFHAWALGHGREQVPIPDALLPPGEPPAPDAPPPSHEPAPPQRRLGANVVGYLQAELGVAEVARQLIGGLDAVGVGVHAIALPVESSRQQHHFVATNELSAPFPVSIVCVNADMFPSFAAAAGERFFDGHRTVGFWWWELSSIPPRFAEAFEHVDEVWVGSRFIAEALSVVSPVPVLRMPMSLSWQVAEPLRPGDYGWPDAFTFLYSYDYNSLFARKNPVAAIDAYTRAFAPSDGAALVLKSINHARHPELHAQVLEAAAGRSDVVVMDEYLASRDKDRLMNSCDCYVSLHRSEGFGLTMAEAMYLGKPVIATGYSGNLDFMTERNSWLVDFELVDVGIGAEPYPPDAQWAAPDIDHAAAAMRQVFDDREEAARRGARAAADLREQYSPHAAGRAMLTRLQAIETHVTPEPPENELGAWVLARSAHDRGRLDLRTHFPGVGSRLGRIGALGRSAVRRAILPYTYHQDRINRDLADAVARSDRRTADALAVLQSRVAESEGRLAAELRRHLEVSGTIVEQLGAEQRERERLGRDLDRFTAQLRRLQAHALQLPPPDAPWTHEYNALHRAFVETAVDEPAFQALFSERRQLPDSYGVGLDERVVEYPWLKAQHPAGQVLDAGSVLNHAHIIERFRPLADELTIATLVTEDVTFPEQDVTYLDADLRELPLPDDHFDTVVCVSTLEHVGMDNTMYGSDLPADEDPKVEARRALAELLRVTRPGGRVLVTVPFGVSERLRWLRVLGSEDLDDLLADVPADRRDIEIFGYSERGWQRRTADEVAGARYRDFTADQTPVADLAAAARAVACVTIRV